MLSMSEIRMNKRKLVAKIVDGYQCAELARI